MPLTGYTIPRTPSGRSSLVLYPPWHYVGDFLVVEYWADPEKAVSVLPQGLDPHPDAGRCALVFADWQSCSDGGDELPDPSRSFLEGGGPTTWADPVMLLLLATMAVAAGAAAYGSSRAVGGVRRLRAA